MLDVADVGVTVDGRRLLSGVSFAVAGGTVTAIVGPNGSGKTTLLRALTGELPHTGRITLNGREIGRTAPRDLAVIRAVLAQDTQVAFPFTVDEILRLGLEAGTGPRDPETVARLLREVDLAGYGPRPYHGLSGGEQQRVHLARVLAQAGQPVTAAGPTWLFLDEPVSSLDIGHQILVMRMAREFADAGGAVVAVMHDLNLTAMTADRVLLLRKGMLLAAGAPDEVLADGPLQAAFGCPVRVGVAPGSGVWLLPQSACL